MARPSTLPGVGRIVEIVRGRDRGLYCVVVDTLDGRFVLLSDGHRRRAEKPKRKNVAHIRSTTQVAQSIVDALAHGQTVTNAKLRYALRLYDESLHQDGKVSEEGNDIVGKG